MKKIMALVIGLTLITGVAWAGSLDVSDVLEKIPNLKTGVAYSVLDSDFNVISTFEVMKYKGLSLEAGMVLKKLPNSETDVPNIPCVVVSYPLFKLADFGVELPILDLIECNLGVYAGYGRIGLEKCDIEANNQFDVGLSATLINIKF